MGAAWSRWKISDLLRKVRTGKLSSGSGVGGQREPKWWHHGSGFCCHCCITLPLLYRFLLWGENCSLLAPFAKYGPNNSLGAFGEHPSQRRTRFQTKLSSLCVVDWVQIKSNPANYMLRWERCRADLSKKVKVSNQQRAQQKWTAGPGAAWGEGVPCLLFRDSPH